MKKFLLVIYKSSGLLVNTLTTDVKYSLLNRDNLTQPPQIQISRKEKKFSMSSFVVLKFKSTFEHFDKKDDAQSLYVSEISDCERRAQIKVSKVQFHKTIQQVTW